MGATVRMNYGVQKTPPSLPCSYQLQPWYPDPGGIAPKKLDIAPYGCFLNGKPIPRQYAHATWLLDNFLYTWMEDTPNKNDQNTDELALSWYLPLSPLGPYVWGTFEFTEDRTALIGIVCHKDVKGNLSNCYVSGTKMAAATPPASPAGTILVNGQQQQQPVSDPNWFKTQPTDVAEMVTLTFPGLTQATCDAMGDDFAWAMDEQWRSKLVAAKRPDINSNLPPAFAHQRLTFLDANAEWFNTVFGPATLGMQLYQDSLPNAKNPVHLDKSLNATQVQQLTTFLHGPLGNMVQAQQEHLNAASAAHFTLTPQLRLYTAEAGAFADYLNRTDNITPSIVTFLGLVAADANLQSAALKLINRYAGLLGALDQSGVLEQALRTEVIAVQLLHLQNQASFTNQQDLQQALSGAFTHILTDPGQQKTDLFATIQKAVTALGSADNLATELAALIYKAAATAPKDGTRVFRIANNSADAFNTKFPAVRIGPQAVLGLCVGYAVFMAVRGYMTWTDLSAAARAELIVSTCITVINGIGVGASIGGAINALTKSEAEIQQAVKALDVTVDAALDGAKAAKGLVAKMNSLDPKVYERASSWLKNFTQGWENFKFTAFFDGFSFIGRMLGPVTAAAALAASIYQLFSDIKSGQGVMQISLDAVNVAIDTALVVCAFIDLVVDLFAVTVVGIVLVALAIVVTAVVALIGWIMRRNQPQSPPDDYMEHVVYPFVSLLPQPAPPASALKVLAVVWRGQVHALPAASAAKL